MINLQCKPFKSTEEQIKLLKDRGLVISDEQYAFDVLRKLNYYRLSAYSLTLRIDNRFYDDITFDNIVELYNFDYEFRHIILRYTPDIEFSFRAYIAYHHTQKYSPLGYLDSKNFSDAWYHAMFLSKLKSYIDKSTDVFITHHKEDLKGIYPLWVVIEVLTFDVLSKLYKNLLPEDKNIIASYYHLGRQYIENWLHIAVLARNISAHGGRFYNRNNLQPVKVDKYLQSKINTSSPFAYIFAIFRLLSSNQLRIDLINDISKLFKDFPFALEKHMGFPDDWKLILEEQMPS